MRISPLKWVGSKSKILNDILPHIGKPNFFVEPFVGSATVSLNVDANHFILNDLNPDLVCLYKNLLANHEKIINDCRPLFMNVTKEKYFDIREEFNQLNHTDFRRSVLFLFLNKFAFNGICRYNSKGVFNVPYSNKILQQIPEKNIKNFVDFFKNKNLTFYNLNFDDVALYQNLQKNDVVYFDPPYLQSNDFESKFVSYTKNGFTLEEHNKIKDIAVSCRKKGIKCIISNHSTDETRDLYKDANDIIYVKKNRTIAAKKENRKKTEELLAIYM
jgi:DNA adenine methylase